MFTFFYQLDSTRVGRKPPYSYSPQKKQITKNPTRIVFFCVSVEYFDKTIKDCSFIIQNKVYIFVLNTIINYFTLTVLIYRCILHFKIIGSFLIFHF